jgi:two-component system response regulator DegU
MESEAQHLSTSRPCVLVIDDHELVRSLLIDVLTSANYRTMEADSGDAALSIIEAHKGGIDCIIQDMSMPVMSGPEIIERTFQIFPEARILVLSVDDEETVMRQVGDLPVAGYLEKPCDTNALIEKVAALIA